MCAGERSTNFIFGDLLQKVYLCRKSVAKLNYQVTIQGVEGCYHDAAAREYFKRRGDGSTVETIPCDTFQSMFDRLDTDASLLGIMAIENTIAGALLQNHELLRKSNLTVVGEHKMRISHVLAALPGVKSDEIKEVHSHPMALMQCELYLRHALPGARVIEAFDTAGSARDIAAAGERSHGAICGEFAAGLYGLDILARSIETNKRNFTRFLILADPLTAPELKPRPMALDKASIVFTLPHSKGALSKILTILSFYDMNLSKIQSMPIIGREWEYRFYIDLTYSDYARYRQSLEAVRPLMNDLKILGEYESCKNEV